MLLQHPTYSRFYLDTVNNKVYSDRTRTKNKERRLKEVKLFINTTGYVCLNIMRKEEEKIIKTSITFSKFIAECIRGEEILQDVDHIDRDKLNNKASNLRVLSRELNKLNNKGTEGAQRHSQSGKWVSTIQFKGKRYYLGFYDSPVEARSAYASARDTLGITHILDNTPTLATELHEKYYMTVDT